MHLEEIRKFCAQHILSEIKSITPLQQAGSDRIYYRIICDDKNYILCYSTNIAENKQFIVFTEHFATLGIHVPTIYAVHDTYNMYLLSDLGNIALLDIVLTEGETDNVKTLYKKAIAQLVLLQSKAQVQYDSTLAATCFDKTQILADVNYFKYYFLDLQKITYNKTLLAQEFDTLSKEIAIFEKNNFMYRDFQARNIMVHNNEVYFIDYQGAMQGPSQYDIASLLWQAKANFSSGFKKELFAYYYTEIQNTKQIDKQAFEKEYSKLVLIRLLQVLGAYGLRGIIERKKHFIESIPHALKNIEEWLQTYSINEYPCLQQIMYTLGSSEFKNKFMPTTNNEQKNGLRIIIQSFSYKQGIPSDTTDNGGGFVFDCRGILNPGRFDEYKKQTGRDKPVIDFLEQKTKMPEFIALAKNIVSISIDDYIARGFKNLMISFGCTGGQHRSVYSTDAMATFIKEKYKLDIIVHHIEQEKKNWVN